MRTRPTLSYVAICCLIAGLVGGTAPLIAQPTTSRAAAEIPIFRSLAGKRVEQGVLIPAPNAAPLQGSAKSVGQPILGGLWFQIDGSASYGPARWDYRWMFRFIERDGQNSVFGLYIDSMGQKLEYSGQYDESAGLLQLTCKLPDGGVSRAQLTLSPDGSVQIENATFDPAENPAVRYSAKNVALP